MEWYHYFANFFCGVFLINALPHLVHGISGNRFPTPFSKPRGIGLSGSVTNCIWGLVNLNFAYILSRHAGFSYADRWSFYIFFLGICALAIPLSFRFKKKHKEPVTELKD